MKDRVQNMSSLILLFCVKNLRVEMGYEQIITIMKKKFLNRRAPPPPGRRGAQSFFSSSSFFTHNSSPVQVELLSRNPIVSTSST